MSDPYYIGESIGKFSDENSFKKKVSKECLSAYKVVLEIENTVEPGMPDLMTVDEENRASFIEIKYAVKGVISFKRTQIPWYKRHHNLQIIIIAYNDLTSNLHFIAAEYLLEAAKTTRYKLKNEEGFIIKEKV